MLVAQGAGITTSHTTQHQIGKQPNPACHERYVASLDELLTHACPPEENDPLGES